MNEHTYKLIKLKMREHTVKNVTCLFISKLGHNYAIVQ